MKRSFFDGCARLFLFYVFPSFSFASTQLLEKKEYKYALSFVAAYVLDAKIRNIVQANRSGGTDDLARIAGNFGKGEVLFPLVGTLYLYGRETGNNRLVRASRKAFKNMATSGALVIVIKWVTGRARPLEERGPRSFQPFSQHDSFPSGDAALAFSVASAFAEEYPGEYEFFAYSVAGLVAYSRIHKDAHWASDILMSAIISTEISRRNFFHESSFYFLLTPNSLSCSLSW